MIRCSQRARAQDFLDGLLEPAEARAFERHAAGCDECRMELALYAQVFALLDDAPTFDPGLRLTERVLDAVLPSRVAKARRLRVLGWGYGAAVALSLSVLTAMATQPLGRAALAGLWGEASHRLFQTLRLALNSLTWVALRVAGLGEWLNLVATKVAPVVRGIGAVAGEPAVALTLTAAALVSCGVIWWMRPRQRAAGEEVRHVAILGF